MRPPLGNGNLVLLEGWPLVRGILNTIIQSLFSEIMASKEDIATGGGGHI